MRMGFGVLAGYVAAAALWSGSVAWAATDVIFQRKGADGTLELTNVPAGDNYSPVANNTPAGVAGASGATVPGGAVPAMAPTQPAAPPTPSPEMVQAAAFAKELDAKVPVSDGNANMRQRMESLYEASRAAREARMQEIQQQQTGRSR